MTSGILAIWNDCEPGHLPAYESWYRTEHLPERLAIPRVVRGRRYLTVGDGPAFFTYYEVETPEVLVSSAYLDRVNNPTPRTRVIMSDAFRNMNRTICTVAGRAGRMRGAWAVTQRLTSGMTPPDLGKLARERGVARAELWQAADLEQPDGNAESRLRGGDASVDGCLFVETLRQADADWVARQLPGAQVYQFLCELEAAPS